MKTTTQMSFGHPIRETVSENISPEKNDRIKHDLRFPFDLNLGIIFLSLEKFDRFWDDYEHDIKKLLEEHDKEENCFILDATWTDREIVLWLTERFVTHEENPCPTMVTLTQHVRS